MTNVGRMQDSRGTDLRLQGSTGVKGNRGVFDEEKQVGGAKGESQNEVREEDYGWQEK